MKTLIERHGDLLEADVDAIAHGANCQGVMGAGIAKAIRKKYPAAYHMYRIYCHDGYAQPGRFQFVRTEDPVRLYNLFSQDQPGANARHQWLRRSLLEMVLHAERHEIDTIGLPRIGCGIGGLKWQSQVGHRAEDVRWLLQRVQAVTDVQLIVYSFEEAT